MGPAVSVPRPDFSPGDFSAQISVRVTRISVLNETGGFGSRTGRDSRLAAGQCFQLDAVTVLYEKISLFQVILREQAPLCYKTLATLLSIRIDILWFHAMTELLKMAY